MSSRTGNTPSEYKAMAQINFTAGFESAAGDYFVAYITDEAGGGSHSSGNNSGEGPGYRYGFNGKENDNEIKGEGNQQDYGMRIYDPRLGRFLSVDPLSKEYPFYSSYQFAGNDVIRCIDLDGGEPLSRTQDWDRNTTFLNGSNSIEVYDKTTNRTYQATGVIDPWTGKMWITSDDGQSQNQYFYLINDDKSTVKLKYYVENGRNVLYKAHFKHFETRNETDAKQGAAIADGIGTAVFGAAVGITAVFAAPIATISLPSLTSASIGTRAVNTGVDYLSQVAGNYSSGKSGSDAWVGNINIVSLGVSAVNPGSSLSKLAFNNTVSSAFSVTSNEGYNGVGSGKSLGVALTQAAIGTTVGRLTRGTDLKINQLTGRLQNVNKLFGSGSPLSTSLQSAIRNTSAIGSSIGVIGGSAGNAVNNKVEEKDN